MKNRDEHIRKEDQMFKVGDWVEINSCMKCDALQNYLGLENLDGTFKIIKVGKQIIIDIESVGDKNEKKYWIFIELPNGSKKRLSSRWLVAADDEKS